MAAVSMMILSIGVSLRLIDWRQWLAINGYLVGLGVPSTRRQVVPVLRSLITMGCTRWMHATTIEDNCQYYEEQTE